MITSLTVKRFKNIESIKIDDIPRLLLIGGVNNVGKTNLLESIFMFHDRLNIEMSVILLKMRGIAGINITPETVFAPIFYNYDMNNDIQIKVVRDKLSENLMIKTNSDYYSEGVSIKSTENELMLQKEEFGQNKVSSFSLDITYEKSGGSKEISHIFLNSDGLGMNIEKAKPSNNRVTIINSRVRSNPNEDAEKYGQLDLIGKQEIIIEMLKIIEPRLKALTPIVIGGISIIHGDIGIGRKVPINYMGDGVSRLLSIVLAIAVNENGMVLIDEIENSIHYSLFPKVWQSIAKIAEEFNCQVIATTHSYEMLEGVVNGLSQTYSSDFKYVRIERNNDNTLNTKTLELEVLKTAVENRMEVRS